MAIKTQKFGETDMYLKEESGMIENETWPLPEYPEVPELSDKTDYELIQMYQGDCSHTALMCMAHRYQKLVSKTLGVMRENWEQPDRMQTAFVVMIETMNKINLHKINPNNYTRCFYLWFRQALLNAIREYKKQLGDVRETVDEKGEKVILQYVGFDEEIHQTVLNPDTTDMAMAKLELWDLLNDDEAYAVELYINDVPFSEQAKRSTLYNLLNSAKAKIADYYKENGIILNI